MIRRSEAFAAVLIVVALAISGAFLVFSDGGRDSSDVVEPSLSQTATEVASFTPTISTAANADEGSRNRKVMETGMRSQIWMYSRGRWVINLKGAPIRYKR